MKVNFLDIKNIQWANSEHTILDCDVNFEHLPEEYVRFSAVASGDLEHTHKIFAECVEGKWGTIAEYVAPPPPTEEEVAAQVRTERDRLLAATDWTQAADVPQATKDKWAPYRQALRDVPAQEGFPYDVVWPTKPS
jgi:hypothetical protein